MLACSTLLVALVLPDVSLRNLLHSPDQTYPWPCVGVNRTFQVHVALCLALRLSDLPYIHILKEYRQQYLNKLASCHFIIFQLSGQLPFLVNYGLGVVTRLHVVLSVVARLPAVGHWQVPLFHDKALLI